jgi:tRNA G18 (ribose-2'-O)-methylase SpoU
MIPWMWLTVVLLLHLSAVATFSIPLSSQRRWIQQSTPRGATTDDADAKHVEDDATWSSMLLERLALTPENATAVRLNLPNALTITPEQINETLSWLEERLDLSQANLRDIVLGYPGVLELSLERNLKPTVSFFADALGDSNDDDALLAGLLCDSPRLLEYNLNKRLIPRFARVKDLLNRNAIDVASLRAIATKTNSRFEEWLKHVESGIPKDDLRKLGFTKNDGDTKPDSNITPQQPDNNSDGPLAFVVLSNLQSGGNIGNIVRSASIFGVAECIVVGQKRYRLTGDHGARLDLPRKHMWSHAEAQDYLKCKKGGIRIYGIEIVLDAAPIMKYDRDTGVVTFPFDRQYSGAAFIFGNEGAGLSDKQREICDEFLFIPQTRGGTKDGGGSASMNVACAAAVILQAYCTWAGYSDAPRDGEKFVVE